MFKSQNIHNLYFCCNRCNSLTFMLDYDEDLVRIGLGHGQYPKFCRYPKCLENIVIVGCWFLIVIKYGINKSIGIII